MKSANPENIKLGDIAKDNISGFEGVVVADTYWLNGCQRLTLQPKEMKDGKPIDGMTFDIEQVKLVKAMNKPAAKPHGGERTGPARRSDPKR